MTLYGKMAARNIKNNDRFFVPRILTEAGLLACFYIIYTLARDGRMRTLKGGAYLPSFMTVGVIVIGLLSAILLLYTNSFLMKQRGREFGLYNVLGMEKRHVAKVLFRESAFCSLSGVALGLSLGLLFYKLCSLLICRLLGVPSILGFYYISPETVLPSALGFLAADLLIYLLNCVSLARMKPVELFASAHAGEKEPKVRWLMLLIGAVCLGLGYYFAISTHSPLEALLLFFAAVILVVIGTYFLFVTGTTFVLQRLKHKESYYYHKKHMTAVSGLLYRMKQNAVGLASICILATGVLVMVSTTVSLYAGTEETLANNYPQELYLSAAYETPEGEIKLVPTGVLTQIIEDAARKSGVEIQEITRQQYLEVPYAFENGVCVTDRDVGSFTNVANFDFITAAAYRDLTGRELNLKENEIALCMISVANASVFRGDTVTIGGAAYRVAESLALFPLNTSVVTAFDRYGVVVANENVLSAVDRDQRDAYGENCSEFTDKLCVKFADRNAACEAGTGIDQEIKDGVLSYIHAQPETREDAPLHLRFLSDTLWEATENVYGMYGSFLFLGILLGLVCLFATALIIYYKQISEGYEDRQRYQIMEKIGMSQREVKGSIKSQVLLVFFLPLAAAGVHVCFAFPMLTKLLRMLLLSKISLFVLCTAITFLAFMLVYVVIYSLTARTYYKIVH